MEAIIFYQLSLHFFYFVSCLVIRRVKKQIAEITDALADVKMGMETGGFYQQQMNW